MTRTASRTTVHLALLLLAVLVLSGCDVRVPVARDSWAQPAPAGTTEVRRVVDGDTIVVEAVEGLPADNDCSGGTCLGHTVRLLGIDSPERNSRSPQPPECGAEASTEHLESLAPPGTRVVLVQDARADWFDRYGRSLAYVELADGTDLGGRQVADGYASAWFPDGEPEPERFGDYADHQAQAAQGGLGLHAECERTGRD